MVNRIRSFMEEERQIETSRRYPGRRCAPSAAVAKLAIPVSAPTVHLPIFQKRARMMAVTAKLDWRLCKSLRRDGC